METNALPLSHANTLPSFNIKGESQNDIFCTVHNRYGITSLLLT